jgi:MFS transporter, DHA2 family, multidrug resistance protein
MTDAVLAPSASRAGANPWLVAAAVVVPTFMEVLDTTIAVVALRYIAGGLSATVDDGEWVITSYLAANAIILPITGWLSAHLGRRNYFLLSIGVFTLASGLCGMATSLGQLIMFRVVQGLAGGGLQPSSQGVLLDAFPPEKQGVAMTLFGLAALLAPVVGPTLGGWITDSYSWRWVFYINVPVGLLALAACYALVRDPDYLTKERAELKRQPFSFDAIGLSLLVIVIVCWEVMLSNPALRYAGTADAPPAAVPSARRRSNSASRGITPRFPIRSCTYSQKFTPRHTHVFFNDVNVSRQRRPASLRVPPLTFRRVTYSRM